MNFTNLERKLIEANLDSMKVDYKKGQVLEKALGGGATIDLSYGKQFELVAILLNGEYSDYLGDFIFDAFEHDINLGAVVDMIEVILDDNSFSLPDVEEMKKLTQYIHEYESERDGALRAVYESLFHIAPKLTDDLLIAELGEVLDDVFKPIGEIGVGVFSTIRRQVTYNDRLVSKHTDDFVKYLTTYGEWVHVVTPHGYEPEITERLNGLAGVAISRCGVDLTPVIKAITALRPYTVYTRMEHPRNTHWI
ncbi:hypothetical protein [Bacillus safensis]|uniref:hypothetical protein n=1 Tax=Bacillus safensis TaxID=561879 RepID=UPI0009BDD518|nr:hypothetical protein [Bacillus safensis]ARD57412.1 hypothetical protein BRL64_15040 [Bacillus safensis]